LSPRRARAGGAAKTSLGVRWLRVRLRTWLGPLQARRLCVAFSGGADSTALLALLAAARERGGYTLRAVHIDHQLQPQSAGWARAARARARALDVPCKVLRVAARAGRGESPEAAARERRYAALLGQLEPGEVLLTAHHLEDQAETLLLQLMRGAGLAGLAAMPQRAERAGHTLLRPLLDQPRAALRACLLRRGLSWSEDPSNSDPRFDRNYVRHELLPRLEARWPAAVRTLARSAAHLAEAQALLDGLLQPALDRAREGRRLRVSALRAHGMPLRRQLLRLWLQGLQLPMPDTARLNELAGPLLAARADAQPEVRWQGVLVHRHAGSLQADATRADQAGALASRRWSWRREPVLALADGAELQLRRDAHGEFPLSALPATLEVRFRSQTTGSLKKLLQELRVPPRLRASVPLVHDGAELIAIGDLWLAPRLRAAQPAVKSGRGAGARGRFRWRRRD